MMNPAFPALWTPPAPATSPARVAFATLDAWRQRMLESVLFDGWSCTELARSLGAAATEIRSEVSAAMGELRAALAVPDDGGGRDHGGGAVAAMLVLRALDALDPDEAALVDAMLAHQPALQRAHAEDCELVGELCRMVPPVPPAPDAFARLCRAIDGDLAN